VLASYVQILNYICSKLTQGPCSSVIRTFKRLLSLFDSDSISVSVSFFVTVSLSLILSLHLSLRFPIRLCSQNVLPINFTQNQIKFVKRKTTWYVCPSLSLSLSHTFCCPAPFWPWQGLPNSAKGFNSYWLACGVGLCACVRPITMKIDGPLIQHSNRGW